MPKKETPFIKHLVQRSIVRSELAIKSRDYSMVSKMYSDLVFNFRDYLNSINDLPENSKIRKPHEIIKLSKHFYISINLICLICESYTFFRKVRKNYSLNSFKVIQKSKFVIPFQDIRNNLGNHYSHDDFYLELFESVYTFYYKKEGKNVVYYMSKEGFDAAFPATNQILWTILYIMDNDKKWKKQYISDKQIYIEKEIKKISENNDLFTNWLEVFQKKIIKHCKEIIKLSTDLLVSISN